MTNCLYDVSSTSLTLGAKHSSTFGNSSKRLAKVSAAANEWDLEVVFVDVVLLISHSENFTLVDIVDL